MGTERLQQGYSKGTGGVHRCADSRTNKYNMGRGGGGRGGGGSENKIVKGKMIKMWRRRSTKLWRRDQTKLVEGEKERKFLEEEALIRTMLRQESKNRQKSFFAGY